MFSNNNKNNSLFLFNYSKVLCWVQCMHIYHLVLPIFFRNVKTDTQKHEMTCPGHLANMWLKLEFRWIGLSPDSRLPSHWVRIRGCTSASGFPEPLILSSLQLGQSAGNCPLPIPADLCVYTCMLTCAEVQGLLKVLTRAPALSYPPPCCLLAHETIPNECQPPGALPQHVHSQWSKPSSTGITYQGL